MYLNVENTFGYITKNVRIANNLSKDHYIDARCISGNPTAVSDGQNMYLSKKVRCHNRQIHKCTINKGGTRKLNQAPKYVFGYQLFDKVKFKDVECFVFGRRSSGGFDLRMLNGTKVNPNINCKKLQLLEKRKTILIERRQAIPPITKVMDSLA